MVDKKDKDLTDKDLEKATGGTGDRQLEIKRTGAAQPGVLRPKLDDPDNPTLTPRGPRTRPGDQISPV